MKTNKHEAVSAMARIRGMNRDRLIRPRSVAFEDRTKYQRSREKQRLIKDQKAADY